MASEQVFNEILEHMVKGLMVHEQFANYYDFLGLQGYRQCHEYHYRTENESYRELCHYYIKRYNKLTPVMTFENPSIIPSSWYAYTRQDVDAKTKQNAVKQGLEKWVEWENDTFTLYEQMYSELMSIGDIAAAAKIKELIQDVEKEKFTAEKYHLNKVATGYDMVNIIEEQKPLHCKYKKC